MALNWQVALAGLLDQWGNDCDLLADDCATWPLVGELNALSDRGAVYLQVFPAELAIIPLRAIPTAA